MKQDGGLPPAAHRARRLGEQGGGGRVREGQEGEGGEGREGRGEGQGPGCHPPRVVPCQTLPGRAGT